MKILRKIMIILGAAILIAALILSAWAYYAYRRPLPKQEGEMSIEGMQRETRIYRDTWGIAHIYAATRYDLFFAQGFVHAQDRWWQMDVSRRIGRGTLSELLGQNDKVQAIDRLARTLGWDQLAQANWEAASPEARLALDAYTAGVNAYIEGRSPGELALEYTVLDLRLDQVTVQPWTPQDSLAWEVALRWEMSGNASQELATARDLTLVDASMLSLLVPLPAALPADYTRLPLDSALALFDLIGPRQMLDGSGWVVSGDRTASGLPLLAVAPNLPIQIPSPWYEIGLYCVGVSAACPYHVTGLSVPGLPAVWMGHNDTIAWGFTSAGIDEQDVLVVQLNPANPMQYEWDGVWRDLTVREELLTINNEEEPLPLTIYQTHAGPLLPLTEDGSPGDQALVVLWSGYRTPADPIGALLRLDRAENWYDFRAALQTWGGAAVHALYADVQGHIGYQVAGNVPRRSSAEAGLIPVTHPGAASEWSGYVAFADLPSTYNPAEGYIIASNSQAEIEALLQDRASHTIETFAAIQSDTTSPFAAQLLPYLLDIDLEDESLIEMRSWLAGWDFRFDMDSAQAALFSAFWLRLLEYTYADELGTVPCDCPNVQQAILELLDYPNHPWWDDVQTEQVTERRDAVLRRAFEQAIADVTKRSGDDRTTWTWGALHTVRFTHVLTDIFGVSVIEDRFNQGPFPVSGSADTINTTPSLTSPDRRFQIVAAPSARLIIDLSNFESSRAMLTTGQSNHLASAHYDDMIDPWRFIEYHPMLWENASIEAAADAMLALEPVAPDLPTPPPDE